METPTYTYERPVVDQILQGLSHEKKLLQIMTGPRQVGKTTAALQLAAQWNGPVVHAAADLPLPPGPEWVRTQWYNASDKLKALQNTDARGVLLVLDEVQKVQGWSEIVKELWDAECLKPKGMHVIILGSSSLLIQKGLSESLAGRFFLHRCTHWGLGEMEKAFGWDMDRWLFFGGYPGTAAFIDNEPLWRRYVIDSLIETVLTKDVLQLQNVTKPALLRHLFLLAAVHPAQILSYNKMLGQLQDAGNTTTLAHYLKLLESAFLISGLELFKSGRLAKRGTSPKLVVWNNGLVNALTGDQFVSSRDGDQSWWGRLVENAVGARLLNHLSEISHAVYYWRHRNLEVDFVIKTPRKLWALEVKSGRTTATPGLKAFCGLYSGAKPLIIGGQGMPFEEFFKTDPREIF